MTLERLPEPELMEDGYAPDLQNPAANAGMRAAFIGGGGSIRPNVVADGLRTIDLAPTIAYLMGIPEPQQSQGLVRLDLLSGGQARRQVSVISLRFSRPTRTDDSGDGREKRNCRRCPPSSNDV